MHGNTLTLTPKVKAQGLLATRGAVFWLRTGIKPNLSVLGYFRGLW